MSESEKLQDLQPEQVLRSFARTPLSMFLIVALVLHAILIFGSSVGYISDTWIDPEGAKARIEAERIKNLPAKIVKPKKEKPGDAKPGEAKPGDTKPTDVKPIDANSGDPAIPEGAQDSKTMKAITELPKPGETPTAPSEDKLLNLDATR